MAIGSASNQQVYTGIQNTPKPESVFASACQRTELATVEVLALTAQLNRLADAIFGQRQEEDGSNQASPVQAHAAWKLPDAQDRLAIAIKAAQAACQRLAPLVEV